MSFFYQEYSKVFIYFVFSLFLAFLILLLSYNLSASNIYTEKASSYECGFDPYEDARNVFDIKFYIVAILFLVFDLEAAFFYPWCCSFSFLDFDIIYCMLDFIFELLFGYIYIWLIGALEW